MAGAGATGGALSILGGIMGSVGDILAAEKYRPPHLPPATGYEQRLRQLAQDQLIGGGQEQLAGTQLYNQMTPLLMSMLPGLSITSRSGTSAGGATGTGGAAGTTPGTPDTGTPMTDYQQALSNYQQAVGRQQQLNTLNKQLKQLKGQSPERAAIRQQRNALRRQKRSQPPVGDLERQMYVAGATPPTFDLSTGDPTQQTGGPQVSPSAQSTLAQIMGFLHGSQDAQSGQSTTVPDFLNRFQTAGGPPLSVTNTPTTGGLPPSMTNMPTTTGY